MSITAAASSTFTAVATGAPTGLVGTMGVKITTLDGTIVTARTTSGITEPSSGTYAVTLTAPALVGRFLVVWDTGGVSPVTAPEDLIVTALPQVTVADVATLLPQRTLDDDSNRVGTFTGDTDPTDEQIQALIDKAYVAVAIRLPTTIAAQHYAATNWLTALYTAMLVELTYFPEQIPDQSPFEQYKALFDEGIGTLVAATLDDQPGGLRFGSIPLVSDTAAASSAWCEDDLTWA